MIEASRCVPSYGRKTTAQQLRKLGAEVVTEDLREIADVESWSEAAVDRRPAERMTELHLSPADGPENRPGESGAAGAADSTRACHQ